jgi:SAM-dependent methyltransferase
LRGDVEHLPIADGAADLAASINIVDRLPHGPAAAFAECHRILRPGGHLIFTGPLNFTEGSLWEEHGRQEAVRVLLESTGFAIETWFDQLAYREILDCRGSFEEFSILAVLARKTA